MVWDQNFHRVIMTYKWKVFWVESAIFQPYNGGETKNGECIIITQSRSFL